MQFFSKNAFIRILVVCLLLLITLCLCVKPAGNRFATVQILQMQSARQLDAISSWVLAYADAHNGNWPHHLSELLCEERANLRQAFFAPNGISRQIPELILTNSVLLNQLSDYAICTNSNALVVSLSGDLNARVIAYERPGLWPDDTVAVSFEGHGVLRMTHAVFTEVLCKKTARLKFDKKTRLFIRGEPKAK